MTLELFRPFPLSTISQGFGKNANESYAAGGLQGHTTIDFDVPWGSPVSACVDGLVYSVIHKDDPDPTQYRAVFQIVQEGNDWYEVSYGHLNEIYVKPGQYVAAGDPIGTVGNTGLVYAGNHLVTKEERLAGSKAGAHLHGPQVRRVRKVNMTSANAKLIMDGFGVYRYPDGSYFEVINYENGFNGCIDPMPLFNLFQAKDARAVRGMYSQLIVLCQKLIASLTPRST